MGSRLTNSRLLPRREKSLDPFDQRVAAGVRVRIAEQNLAGDGFERGEQRVRFAGGVAGDGGGVIGDQDGRRQFDAKPGLQLLTAHQDAAPQMVERRRSGAMHAPLLFAHGDDAGARRLGGCEMHVAQLGERVADRVVNGAFADFAAFDVRDGDAQRQRDGRRRQHLVAVGDEEQQIGTHLAQAVGEPERRHADGFRHADVGVRTEQAFDARVDGKAGLLDFAAVLAEFRRQMRTDRDDRQVDLRVRRTVRASGQ